MPGVRSSADVFHPLNLWGLLNEQSCAAGTAQIFTELSWRFSIALWVLVASWGYCVFRENCRIFGSPHTHNPPQQTWAPHGPKIVVSPHILANGTQLFVPKHAGCPKKSHAAFKLVHWSSPCGPHPRPGCWLCCQCVCVYLHSAGPRLREVFPPVLHGGAGIRACLGSLQRGLTIQAGGGAPTYLRSAPPAPSKPTKTWQPTKTWAQLHAQRAPRCALGASGPCPLVG